MSEMQRALENPTFSFLEPSSALYAPPHKPEASRYGFASIPVCRVLRCCLKFEAGTMGAEAAVGFKGEVMKSTNINVR
jgi:hypothetical protein